LAPTDHRTLIAYLIGELGAYQGVGLLVSGLAEESPLLRASCASSLGRLAPPGVSRALAELLEDRQPCVREAALAALQRVSGADSAELALLCAELAQSHQPEKRCYAALLLAGLGDGDRLFLLAKDEDPSVRRAAISSLARARGRQAVGYLAMALSDEEPEVRVVAARALSEIGGQEVLKPLLLALSDSDPWVQTAALKGLALLGDPSSLFGVAALVARARGPVLIAGLTTLAAVGGGEALAAVREALDDDDEEVVVAAIGILSGFGSDWIFESCQALVGHQHWGVRRSFVRAIAKLLGEKARPMLEEALERESDSLVKGEISALLNGLN
jgi:HEAT repeat protein